MKTIAILRNDLACYLRDRPALFWTFIGPVVCMILFGQITQPRPAPIHTIVLVDCGAGAVAGRMAGFLRAEGYPVRQASEGGQDEWQVDVTPDPAGKSAARLLLHGAVHEFDEEWLIRLELEKALLRAGSATEARAAIEVVPASPGFSLPSVTRGYQRTAPAFLLMFLTMNLLIAGANLAEDREGGRLRRIVLAPVSSAEIVAGKLLARLAVAWCQMALIFALAVFLFHIRFASHWLLLVGFVSLYTIAMGAAGLLIGIVFHDPDHAQAVAIWTAMLAAPLSGLWWPVDALAAPFRLLADCLPTGWAMRGVNAMLAFGAGPPEIAWPAAGLGLMFVCCFFFACSRLRA